MVNQVLNIKVLREIKNNFKTYLSVILIATLAVTLFTGIWANYKNFESRLDHIYEEANMCDGIVMLTKPDEEVDNLISSKASYYEKRVYLSTKFNNENIYLATFNNDSKLNLPYQTSTPSIDEKMVLVDKNFLSRNNKDIGDTFEIKINGLYITLTISGTMTHPESLENSAYNPSFIYVGEEALEEALKKAIPIAIPLDSLKNQYLIKGEESIFSEIKDELSENESFIYSLKRSDLLSNRTIDADVIQAKKLIYIFPVIFYLVAVLIILTSISQLIHRESKNIGLLKALGFNKSEILMHYTNIFIVLGLIGSILGIILGPIIVPTVMGRKYNLLYQLPSISLPFFRWEYLISVGLLLIIIVLVSIFACRGAMNMVPAASLRGENAVSMRISFLDHFSFMKKIPLAILMAFRNMKRKISRTLMVLLGVMGCSALLVCGFGIEDTINYGIDLELEELIPYDLSLTYGTYDSKKDILDKKEEISAYDEYAKYTISIEKESMISAYIYLLPTELNVFNVDCQKNDCIISSKVAKEIKAKVGDEIHFVYQNKTYDLKISKVVDFCISQGIFITLDTFVEIPFEPTGAWINTIDGTNNEAFAEELKIESGIVSILTITQMKERAEDVLASIKVMTWTIKIFAILLAVVVLYNLALLNFKERIKDIATLKVLGFSRFEVASSLMIEIIFLTFIGALVGLALGYPLLVSVLSINENPLLSYIYHINLSSYCLTVLITCGSSLLINLIFAILTNKVQMVESLKSVE